MKKANIPLLFLTLLLLTALTGCQEELPTKQTTGQTEPAVTSMEQEPVLSYEVPVSVPGIVIDRIGYITGSTKIAVFSGQEMPEHFWVMDEKTGKAVYTGTLEEKLYDKITEKYYCYGDFSALISPGTYYIEAPVLGRSYSFEVGDEVYISLFGEACKQYYYNRCGMTLTTQFAGSSAHNACHTGKAVLQSDTSVTLDVSGGWHQDEKGQKNVDSAARTIATLLLAYELYPDAFTDDVGIPESGNGIPDILDEIKYEIDWLLKMQDSQTGAVYGGITVYAKDGDSSSKVAEVYVEPASLEACKGFAMALAKFSYLYQNYDTEYATNCLKTADRAWKYVTLNEKDKEADAEKFAAAAELYRASGQETYHQYLTQYLRSEAYKTQWNETVMVGCVTYLSTKHTVNRGYCENVMNLLMEKAEEISYVAREAVYFAAEKGEQDYCGQMLLEMMNLSVVNRIISNHEYETVIENHLHYFLGRNEAAENHVTDNAGIMKQFEQDSKLILMLSGILANGI